MVEWRFGGEPDEGEQWLAHPDAMYVYVEFSSPQLGWRRVMVVTRAWLLNHLNGVHSTLEQPRWVVLPTMLVLTDAKGPALRRKLDEAVQHGGLDLYSTPV